MSIEGYTRLGGDFSEPFDLETIKALLETKDTIGSVLRIHFCFERFLDLWCNKITNCEDFFNFGKGNGRATFSMKIAISVKLGLPIELATVLRKFNSIRNTFAHQTNIKISNQNFNDIRHLIDQIPSHGDRSFPKMNDPSWKGEFDGRMIFWSMPNISETDKLLLIYFTFSIKATSIFVKEFVEKKIVHSYSE